MRAASESLNIPAPTIARRVPKTTEITLLHSLSPRCTSHVSPFVHVFFVYHSLCACQSTCPDHKMSKVQHQKSTIAQRLLHCAIVPVIHCTGTDKTSLKTQQFLTERTDRSVPERPQTSTNSTCIPSSPIPSPNYQPFFTNTVVLTNSSPLLLFSYDLSCVVLRVRICVFSVCVRVFVFAACLFSLYIYWCAALPYWVPGYRWGIWQTN